MMQRSIVAASPPPKIVSQKVFHILGHIQFFIALLACLTLFFSTFYVSYIPSSSMAPTLPVGSVIVTQHTPADQLDYGDIVCFLPFVDEIAAPHNGFEVLRDLSFRKMELRVKRVVGLPGDILEVRDGFLWRNGEKQMEAYTAELTNGEFGPYAVPQNTLFLMGDNRNNSADSRMYGAYPYYTIVGKVVFSIT